MTTARMGVQVKDVVKFKVVGQANAVGPTSIEGSFVLVSKTAESVQLVFAAAGFSETDVNDV